MYSQVWHAPDLQSRPQLVCPSGTHGGQTPGQQWKMLLVSCFLRQGVTRKWKVAVKWQTWASHKNKWCKILVKTVNTKWRQTRATVPNQLQLRLSATTSSCLCQSWACLCRAASTGSSRYKLKAIRFKINVAARTFLHFSLSLALLWCTREWWFIKNISMMLIVMAERAAKVSVSMMALLSGITPGAPSALFWATLAASGNGTVKLRWMTSR